MNFESNENPCSVIDDVSDALYRVLLMGLVVKLRAHGIDTKCYLFWEITF